MSRLSFPWMMSRQNVASSRIRSVPQPWFAGRGLEGIPGGGNTGTAGVGEEVEVLGRSGGQVLRDQGRATGLQEARGCRQGKEELSDLDLEVGQGQRLLPTWDRCRHRGVPASAESMTSDQAARKARGSTRLSHRSTSKAPSR